MNYPMGGRDSDVPPIKAIVGGIVVALLIILSVITIIGVSQNKASATRWGCVYGGGLLDTPNLKQTVAPGTRGSLTIYDDMRTVPADVRDYIIDADDAARDPNAVPISLPVRARDIVVGEEVIESVGVTTILVELQAKFVFNENACDWDEKYGRGMDNLNFDTPQGEVSGWTTWLKNNMYKRIQEAARPVVRDFDWLQLSTNQQVTFADNTDQVFDILAAEIALSLTTELEASLGANFFCGPSYAFDGSFDGELETCPPIEISITELTPENPDLLANYETIVANAEAQQKIASDRDRAIAQADADADTQTAVAQADSRTQQATSDAQAEAELAETERRRATDLANAEADLAVAEAQTEVEQVRQENELIKAQADAAYCAELAEVGESCVLQDAVNNNALPDVVVGGNGTGLDILLPVPEPESVPVEE